MIVYYKLDENMKPVQCSKDEHNEWSESKGYTHTDTVDCLYKREAFEYKKVNAILALDFFFSVDEESTLNESKVFFNVIFMADGVVKFRGNFIHYDEAMQVFEYLYQRVKAKGINLE